MNDFLLCDLFSKKILLTLLLKSKLYGNETTVKADYYRTARVNKC